MVPKVVLKVLPKGQSKVVLKVMSEANVVRGNGSNGPPWPHGPAKETKIILCEHNINFFSAGVCVCVY